MHALACSIAKPRSLDMIAQKHVLAVPLTCAVERSLRYVVDALPRRGLAASAATAWRMRSVLPGMGGFHVSWQRWFGIAEMLSCVCVRRQSQRALVRIGA